MNVNVISPGSCNMGDYKGSLCRREHDDGTGHSLRNSNGDCIKCAIVWHAERYKKNKISAAAKNAEWYQQNKETVLRNVAEWQSHNIDKVRIIKKRWKVKNPARVTAGRMKYYTGKKCACPQWADQDKILEFYKEAQRLTSETGIKHEVDHKIPLHGKLVSGLHVPNNLQVLTAYDNAVKHNHFTIE